MRVEIKTKTAEEILKDCLNDSGVVHATVQKYPEFEAAIVEAMRIYASQFRQEWILVSDPPGNNESVLCFDGIRMQENSYSEHTNQDIEWFKRVFTFWKPLPPKPKTA